MRQLWEKLDSIAVSWIRDAGWTYRRQASGHAAAKTFTLKGESFAREVWAFSIRELCDLTESHDRAFRNGTAGWPRKPSRADA